MATVMEQRLRRLGYRRTRFLLLGTGLIVLLLVSAMAWIRRVETVEVVATLLFIPVFIGVVFWTVRGGFIAALLSSGVYMALRIPAVDAVGIGRFLGLLISRTAALVVFGLVGGWAVRQLEQAVRKLDVYDQVDDETGLLNARFFLQGTDLELSRANRYGSIFSVSAVDIPARALDGLSRRRAVRTLRQLGDSVHRAIRVVDRAVHVRDDGGHRLAVILPETGREGAQVFTDRLADRVAALLTENGSRISTADLTTHLLSLPDDRDGLEAMREEFRRIDRAERPEAPEAEAVIPG